MAAPTIDLTARYYRALPIDDPGLEEVHLELEVGHTALVGMHSAFGWSHDWSLIALLLFACEAAVTSTCTQFRRAVAHCSETVGRREGAAGATFGSSSASSSAARYLKVASFKCMPRARSSS